MALFRKKAVMPAKRRGLPCRSTPLRVPEKHFVNGHRLTPPFPADYKKPYSEWAASARRAARLGKPPASTHGDGLTRAATPPTPPTKRFATGSTGHTEVVKVIYDPKRSTYEDLLKSRLESHDPTQGMRQGNDVGTSIGRRSMCWMRSRSRRLRNRSQVPGAVDGGG